MSVHHLLVDFGEVISHPQTGQDISEMADAAGLDEHTFSRRYWQHRPRYDLGGTALAYWSAVLGRDGDPRAGVLVRTLVAADLRSWMRLNHAVLDVLAAARRQGRQLSLLSNAPHELADAVSAHPAFTVFDHLVFSARIGLAKPDPAAFRAALDRIGAPACDVLFVDDRAENVAAAATLGLQTCRFTGTDQLRRRLFP